MLTPKQEDALTEIVNIGVGKGSATLSEMIDTEIILHVPYVNVISFDELLQEFEKMSVENVHTVEMKFYGEYEGISNVILSSDSATQLASLLTKEAPDSEALKQIRDGIMTEVGNIILNAVMGSFGNILEVPFNFRVPHSYEGKISTVYEHLDRKKFSQILICRTNFSISGKNISGEILIMYEVNSFNKLKIILDEMLD